MIAQADSRKWMACLYNSFLFMEAKIMKMAKKLLALVLTGVMAMSMLTGCALSDKAKAEALEKALNSDAAQGKVDVDYKYDSNLNDEAHKIWTTAKTNTNNMLGEKIPANVATKTELTVVTIGTKNYGYFILTAPEKKDAKDKLEWVNAAKKFDTAVANKQISASTVGQVKNYASGTTGNKKVKFGVEFVDNGQTGDKKDDYAIVVVEINK